MAENPNIFIWNHSTADPEGSTLEALDVATGKQWDGLASQDSIRALRTLTLLTLLEARLSNDQMLRDDDGSPILGAYDAEKYPTPWHLFAASTMLRTLPLLVPDHPSGLIGAQSATIITKDGDPPAVLRNPFETAAIPIAVYVVGTCVASLAAVAIAWIGGEVVDRQLERDETTRRMQQSSGNVLELMNQHMEREKDAGKPLLFTDAEKDALEALLSVQKEVANQKRIPLPVPFEGAVESVGSAIKSVGEGVGKATESVGEGVGKVGAGVGEASSWLLPALVVGGIAAVWYSANSSNSRNSRAEEPRRLSPRRRRYDDEED